MISDRLLASTRAFSKGPPSFFPEAHALRYGYRKFGNDWIYIRGEWALEGGIEASFSGTGWSARGDFRWILASTRAFAKGPPLFSKYTCPEVWVQKIWERLDVYSRRMGL